MPNVKLRGIELERQSFRLLGIELERQSFRLLGIELEIGPEHWIGPVPLYASTTSPLLLGGRAGVPGLATIDYFEEE